MAFGKELVPYGSKLMAGPLGVVKIGGNGFDYGLTNADTILKPDMDIKDIMYQQSGTKAADHVPTGVDWLLTGAFAEISTELLVKIAPYLVGSSGSEGSDSGHFRAKLYESMLDTYAQVVKVASVEDETASENIEDIMFFYQGIFLIDGDLINWGADSQRSLPFTVRLKPRKFTTIESPTVRASAGYWGDPSVEDLPAAVWPDLEAPYPVSALVTLETEMTVTFSEDITEVAAVDTLLRSLVVTEKANGQKTPYQPTVADYTTNVLTLTFAASTFLTTDIIEFTMSAGTCEDGDSNANEDIENFSVVNPL